MSLDPTFIFTIPSIHDDLDLHCRIYCPAISVLAEPSWHPRGAIIAHPYAPLGGCYDDGIVLSLVQDTLRQGYVVGTFNFRGASGSKGSASWTGNGEVNDYVSAAGLLIHFLHRLRTKNASQIEAQDSHSGVSEATTPVTFLFAGYSYGALTVTRLPDTSDILAHFGSPSPGSAASEILLRARSLFNQLLQELRSHQNRRQSRRGRESEPRVDHGAGHMIIMGGDESDPSVRRRSREAESASRLSVDAARKSFDRSCRSFERSRQRILHRNNRSSADGDESPLDSRTNHAGETSVSPTISTPLSIQTPPESKIDRIEVNSHYLLVSPLLGPLAQLATMFKMHSAPALAFSATKNPQLKLSMNRTLVIYGSEDVFTSNRRLRRWSEDMAQGSATADASENGSNIQEGEKLSRKGRKLFEWKEVPNAGHFWREDGAFDELNTTLAEWLKNTTLLGVGENIENNDT